MNFAQFIRSSTLDTIHRPDRVDNMKQFRILEPKLSKSHRARNEDIDPPIERSGHRMLCDEDYVYVVGGYCPYYSEQLIQEIWRFNILTEEWELMDAEGDHFPPEMASFSLCAEGSDAWKRAFLFGGTMVPFGDESSNRVTMLKKLPDAKFTWQPLALVGEEPIQQYGSAILMHNGVLYQIGGTTGHIYNMEVRSLTPVWTETNKPCASNFPEPHLWKWTLLNKAENEWGRYRHEVELVGHEIIIIGGGNPHWASTLDTLLVFDICSNEFKKRSTIPDENYGYPPPRMCHACVKYDNKIYIIGGCSEKKQVIGRRRALQEIPEVYDDIWELDTTTWKWNKLGAKLHNKTCFHAAVVTKGGCVYVFGGVVDGAFTKRCSVMQRLWLRVPSLEYLTMRTVLSIYPELLHNRPLDSPEFTLSTPATLIRSIFALQQKREENIEDMSSNNYINLASYVMRLVLG